MFQIFIPGPTSDNPAELKRVGLGSLSLDANSLAESAGPTGQGGVLWFWQQPGKPTFGYRPDEQKWIPAVPVDGHEAGRYWVEVSGDLSPAALRRPYQESGDSLQLGDGNEWLFPSAKELPRDLIIQDNGDVKFELQRKYAAFGIEVDRWFSKIVSGMEDSSSSFRFSDMLSFATMALTVNYRITSEVINELRLFSTATVKAATLAAIGLRKPE